MGTTIYLDESGCLGWKLDQPYKQGGSSRFFTLAAASVPDDADPLLSRVVRGLYKKRNRSTSKELKSVSLKSGERVRFANSLRTIWQSRHDVLFMAITVRKENVGPAFRRSPNGLYNYMTKLLLLDVMAEYDSVSFIPDARSIKVEFKHDLHKYLETELAARSNAFLQTTPWDSRDSLPLQFVDIMAGIVWAHHEYRSGEAYVKASPCIRQKTLFF